MVGISHLQQLYLNTNWLDLITMRKPNGESHTYAYVTERQLSGKQFSIMYIRKRPNWDIDKLWVTVLKPLGRHSILELKIYVVE